MPSRNLVPLALCALLASTSLAVAADGKAGDPVALQWGVHIPMRDGVKLAATLYRPRDQKDALPCVFTLTPYIAQSYHDRGMYFAAHGYVFLTIDVRGRGNSGGTFTPMLQEAKDGHDIVEWLGTQPYCNGKVTMWGGSYAGYDQWATAKELPSHLATIVPVASPKPGVDYPMRNNIFYPYDMQWLTYVSGHASQEKIFGDSTFWNSQQRRWYEAHAAFSELDAYLGNPSPIFHEWIAHPMLDAYWDSFSPTREELARLDIPMLTITGVYDADQPGALAYYRDYMRDGPATGKDRHYLIIGPWDHPGTRTPQADVAGLKFGEKSLLDMNALHTSWYDWTMKNGAKPRFLKDKVAFYMIGEEAWRYAPTLDAVTARSDAWYLDSVEGHANDVFASGSLDSKKKGSGKPDRYIYDPLDVSPAEWQVVDYPDAYKDQRAAMNAAGKQLVYHTAPFEKDTDVAGFFKLSAWISLDQPDTDLWAMLFEVKSDGSTVFIADDMLRARYRKSLREATLAKPGAIERYDFDHFTFATRRIEKGSRLRLTLAPMNWIVNEKNFNAGGVVSNETGKDARTVTVTLYHDAAHPSALSLPVAASSSVPEK